MKKVTMIKEIMIPRGMGLEVTLSNGISTLKAELRNSDNFKFLRFVSELEDLISCTDAEVIKIELVLK